MSLALTAGHVGAHAKWPTTQRVQTNLGRPELFPAWTQDQMRPEVIDEQLEQRRDDMTHPLLGIHSEQDWQEFKAACAPHAYCVCIMS